MNFGGTSRWQFRWLINYSLQSITSVGDTCISLYQIPNTYYGSEGVVFFSDAILCIFLRLSFLCFMKGNNLDFIICRMNLSVNYRP